MVDGTLRAACGDRSAEIRIWAATALGDDGLDTLMAMTDDMGLGDAWSAAAVTALGRRFSFEGAKATLDRALHGRRFETARACIEVLGSTNQAAIEPLVRALEVETSLVPAAAARALGSLGAAAAEAPLISALRGDAPGLRIAAAEALGRCGSVSAVAPLRAAGERHSESAFRRAVRQAVAESRRGSPAPPPVNSPWSSLRPVSCRWPRLRRVSSRSRRLSAASYRSRRRSCERGAEYLVASRPCRRHEIDWRPGVAPATR